MQIVESLENLKKLQVKEILTQMGVIKIVRLQWSAILDRKVCQLCFKLDGMVIPANSPIYNVWQPPLHLSGRCLWVGIDIKDPNIPTVNWKEPAKDLIKEFAPDLLGLPGKEIVIDKILPIPIGIGVLPEEELD
jgi:hypothetical protein